MMDNAVQYLPAGEHSILLYPLDHGSSHIAVALFMVLSGFIFAYGATRFNRIVAIFYL